MTRDEKRRMFGAAIHEAAEAIQRLLDELDTFLVVVEPDTSKPIPTDERKPAAQR